MKKIINRAAVLVLCVWLAVQSVSAAKVFIPGGQVIGLSLQDNTVTVAAFDQQLGQAAKDAGHFTSAGLEHGHTFLRLTDLCGYENTLLAMADEDENCYIAEAKVNVLKYISNTYINLYRINDMYDYYYGKMAYSTGQINDFKLTYIKEKQ